MTRENTAEQNETNFTISGPCGNHTYTFHTAEGDVTFTDAQIREIEERKK